MPAAALSFTPSQQRDQQQWRQTVEAEFTRPTHNCDQGRSQRSIVGVPPIKTLERTRKVVHTVDEKGSKQRSRLYR